MRASPARPLIPGRRKLHFRPNHPSRSDASESGSAPGSAAGQRFPDGIHILDHATVSDTQEVFIANTADLQSVIEALTAKGKECGVQGPDNFLLFSDSGSVGHPAAEADGSGEQLAEAEPERSPGVRALTGGGTWTEVKKDLDLDDSLTDIQWLSRISTFALEPDPAKEENNKENQNPSSQTQDAHIDAEAVEHRLSEKPPYSYMAMIQFAINSNRSRRMTLREIYMWIEDHFPYFKQGAKPGWKNSIRHNLSLHDMFVRETSPDGKVSYWTIRPEANRCLTLDQVTQQQKRKLPDPRETPAGSERRIKPLLPQSDSSSVPLQLPVTSSVYLPSSSAQFPSSCSEQKQNTSQGVKRMWIAPKVAQGDALSVVMYPQESKDLKVKVNEEPVCFLMKCQTPKSIQKRQGSRLRRKQQLIPFREEEPVLLWPDNTELKQQENHSSPLTSSTPSKPACNVLAETWKFTPVTKAGQSVLDSKHIHTPDGPAAPVGNDYTTFSFSSTPFKDWPLFNSPREPLSVTPSRANGPAVSPTERLRSSCSRELLQAGDSTSANRSLTEGQGLDTMNVSLSELLLDISFSGLDDEDLGMANISWSDLFP